MEQNKDDELSLALRLTRIARGMSQRKLAAVVGFTPETWNIYELGRRRLEPKVAARALKELKKDAPASPIVSLLLMECDRLIGGVK